MKSKKKVTTVPVETTVTYLKEPEVSFVSLVKHGANNTPFRVIKENKEGQMNKVVQAIKVPKDSNVDLKTIVGKDFRKDTVEEEGSYLVYEQVEKSVCDPDSKSVVVLDPENNVYAVTYNLLAEKETIDTSSKWNNKTGIQLKEYTKKEDGPKLPEGESNIIVSELNVKELSYWDVMDELYSMVEMISGAMGQSSREQNSVKDIVLDSIDNFRSYCENLFSDVKYSSRPKDAKTGDIVTKTIEIMKTNDSNKKGGDTMLELKDKEELVGIITETVDKVLKDREDKESTKAEIKAKEDKEKEKEKEINTLKDSVKALEDTITTMKGTVVTGILQNDPAAISKSGEQSVYDGMFRGMKNASHGVSDLS